MMMLCHCWDGIIIDDLGSDMSVEQRDVVRDPRSSQVDLDSERVSNLVVARLSFVSVVDS